MEQTDFEAKANALREELLQNNSFQLSALVTTLALSWRQAESQLLKLPTLIFNSDVMQRRIQIENVMAVLSQQLDNYAAQAGIISQNAVAPMVELGAAHALTGTAAAAGVAEDSVPLWSKLAADEFRDIVGANTEGGLPGDVLRGVIHGILDKWKEKFTERVSDPAKPPVTPDAITRELRNEVKPRVQAAAMHIQQTSGIKAYRSGVTESYKKNRHLIDGWQWVTNLTPETCAMCIGMSGTIHPIEEEMQSHLGCRCIPAPHLRTWKDLGVKGIEEDRVDARILDGPRWFENLSDDEKLKVLGPSKFEAYKSGQIRLVDLVGFKHNETGGDSFHYEKSLKEILEGRDSSIFKVNNPVAELIDPLNGLPNDDMPGLALPSVPSGKSLADLFDHIPDGEAGTQLRTAIETIGRVHGYSNINLHGLKNGKLEFRVFDKTNGWDGQYSVNRLSLRRDAYSPVNTLVHELGHMIDNRVYGDPTGLHGSWLGSADGIKSLRNWEKACDGSAAQQELFRLSRTGYAKGLTPDGRTIFTQVDSYYVEYLKSIEETFARSYEQYIATRSGNPSMLAEIAYTRRASNLYRGAYWSEEDFRPIARAMDEMFAAQGMLQLRGTTPQQRAILDVPVGVTRSKFRFGKFSKQNLRTPLQNLPGRAAQTLVSSGLKTTPIEAFEELAAGSKHAADELWWLVFHKDPNLAGSGAFTPTITSMLGDVVKAVWNQSKQEWKVQVEKEWRDWYQKSKDGLFNTPDEQREIGAHWRRIAGLAGEEVIRQLEFFPKAYDAFKEGVSEIGKEALIPGQIAGEVVDRAMIIGGAYTRRTAQDAVDRFSEHAVNASRWAEMTGADIADFGKGKIGEVKSAIRRIDGAFRDGLKELSTISGGVRSGDSFSTWATSLFDIGQGVEGFDPEKLAEGLRKNEARAIAENPANKTVIVITELDGSQVRSLDTKKGKTELSGMAWDEEGGAKMMNGRIVSKIIGVDDWEDPSIDDLFTPMLSGAAEIRLIQGEQVAVFRPNPTKGWPDYGELAALLEKGDLEDASLEWGFYFDIFDDVADTSPDGPLDFGEFNPLAFRNAQENSLFGAAKASTGAVVKDVWAPGVVAARDVLADPFERVDFTPKMHIDPKGQWQVEWDEESPLARLLPRPVEGQVQPLIPGWTWDGNSKMEGVDFSDQLPGSTEDVIEILRRDLPAHYQAPTEIEYALNSTGEIVHRTVGQAESINYTEADKQAYFGRISIHNHPLGNPVYKDGPLAFFWEQNEKGEWNKSGRRAWIGGPTHEGVSFSEPDLDMRLQNPLKVVVSDFYYYTLKAPSDGWKRSVRGNFQTDASGFMAKAKSKLKQAGLTTAEAEVASREIAIRMAAEKWGATYQRFSRVEGIDGPLTSAMESTHEGSLLRIENEIRAGVGMDSTETVYSKAIKGEAGKPVYKAKAPVIEAASSKALVEELKAVPTAAPVVVNSAVRAPAAAQMIPVYPDVANRRFLAAQTREDLTTITPAAVAKGAESPLADKPIGHTFVSAIPANPEKRNLQMLADTANTGGSIESDGGKIIKVNAFRSNRIEDTGGNWEWLETVGEKPVLAMAKDANGKVSEAILSVEEGADHYYTLNFDSGNAATRLVYYPGGNPILRPTTKGKVIFGPIIGKIKVRGAEHPVYEWTSVQAIVKEAKPSKIKPVRFKGALMPETAGVVAAFRTVPSNDAMRVIQATDMARAPEYISRPDTEIYIYEHDGIKYFVKHHNSADINDVARRNDLFAGALAGVLGDDDLVPPTALVRVQGVKIRSYDKAERPFDHLAVLTPLLGKGNPDTVLAPLRSADTKDNEARLHFFEFLVGDRDRRSDGSNWLDFAGRKVGIDYEVLDRDGDNVINGIRRSKMEETAISREHLNAALTKSKQILDLVDTTGADVRRAMEARLSGLAHLSNLPDERLNYKELDDILAAQGRKTMPILTPEEVAKAAPKAPKSGVLGEGDYSRMVDDTDEPYAQVRKYTILARRGTVSMNPEQLKAHFAEMERLHDSIADNFDLSEYDTTSEGIKDLAMFSDFLWDADSPEHLKVVPSFIEQNPQTFAVLMRKSGVGWQQITQEMTEAGVSQHTVMETWQDLRDIENGVGAKRELANALVKSKEQAALVVKANSSIEDQLKHLLASDTLDMKAPLDPDLSLGREIDEHLNTIEEEVSNQIGDGSTAFNGEDFVPVESGAHEALTTMFDKLDEGHTIGDFAVQNPTTYALTRRANGVGWQQIGAELSEAGLDTTTFMEVWQENRDISLGVASAKPMKDGIKGTAQALRNRLAAAPAKEQRAILLEFATAPETKDDWFGINTRISGLRNMETNRAYGYVKLKTTPIKQVLRNLDAFVEDSPSALKMTRGAVAGMAQHGTSGPRFKDQLDWMMRGKGNSHSFDRNFEDHLVQMAEDLDHSSVKSLARSPEFLEEFRKMLGDNPGALNAVESNADKEKLLDFLGYTGHEKMEAFFAARDLESGVAKELKLKADKILRVQPKTMEQVFSPVFGSTGVGKLDGETMEFRSVESLDAMNREVAASRFAEAVGMDDLLPRMLPVKSKDGIFVATAQDLDLSPAGKNISDISPRDAGRMTVFDYVVGAKNRNGAQKFGFNKDLQLRSFGYDEAFAGGTEFEESALTLGLQDAGRGGPAGNRVAMLARDVDDLLAGEEYALAAMRAQGIGGESEGMLAAQEALRKRFAAVRDMRAADADAYYVEDLQAAIERQAMKDAPAPKVPGKSLLTKDAPLGVIAAKFRSREAVKKPLDQDLMKAIADYHDSAVDDRDGVLINKSYDAFKKETRDQYDALVQSGYSIEPWAGEGEPYTGSKQMMEDVRDNKHLYYLQSRKATGQNEADNFENYTLFEDTGIVLNGEKVVYNDLFRAVHDVLGHAEDGNSFSAQGEMNAFYNHSEMYSEAAIPALFLETTTYNAWFNFGKHRRDELGNIIPKVENVYAPRKIYFPDPDHIEAVMRQPKTGKGFSKFFEDVTAGRRDKSQVEFQPLLPPTGFAKKVDETLTRYSGNFSDHIKKSIPTFHEAQVGKATAIVEAYKGQHVEMLDIGGSEGSFAKSITAESGGAIETTVLDPNPEMAKVFRSSPLAGTFYEEKALGNGWTEDDGTVIESYQPTKKFDVVHETMVFQFISNEREDQLSEVVDKLLKPDGVLIMEEKFWPDEMRAASPAWKHGEAFKDANYKNRYFDAKTLAEKQKTVGFADAKDAPPAGAQSAHAQKNEGMAGNMVGAKEFEQMLGARFTFVAKYWESGNFSGYIATNEPKKALAILEAMPPMNAEGYSSLSQKRYEVVKQATLNVEANDPAPQFITIHRGGGAGNYYSSSAEYAAEFGPVRSMQVSTKRIFDASLPEHQKQVVDKFGQEALDTLLKNGTGDLPSANDAEALDLLDEVVPALGYSMSKQSEGKGQPFSVFLHKRRKATPAVNLPEGVKFMLTNRTVRQFKAAKLDEETALKIFRDHDEIGDEKSDEWQFVREQMGWSKSEKVASIEEQAAKAGLNPDLIPEFLPADQKEIAIKNALLRSPLPEPVAAEAIVKAQDAGAMIFTKTNSEEGTVSDRDGNILIHLIGETTSVPLPDWLRAQMSGLIFDHTHPDFAAHQNFSVLGGNGAIRKMANGTVSDYVSQSFGDFGVFAHLRPAAYGMQNKFMRGVIEPTSPDSYRKLQGVLQRLPSILDRIERLAEGSALGVHAIQPGTGGGLIWRNEVEFRSFRDHLFLRSLDNHGVLRYRIGVKQGVPLSSVPFLDSESMEEVKALQADVDKAIKNILKL